MITSIIINLNVNGAHTLFIQFNSYWSNIYLLNISNLSYSFENTLNMFYSCVVVFNSYNFKLRFNSIQLEIPGFIVLVNTIMLLFLAYYFNFYLSIFLSFFFVFNSKIFVFNSDLLDILREDAVGTSDSGSSEPVQGSSEPAPDSEPTSDESTEQKIKLKASVQTWMLLQKLPAVDNDTMNEILLSIIKRRKDDSIDNQCLALDVYIQKLMHSSGVSKEDLEQVIKSIKISSLDSLVKKSALLRQKRFYSLSELLLTLKSLNKLRNNLLVLPSGIIVFITTEENLKMLSLPAVIKVSQKNLEQIIRMLNLRKKLNLYLTKECYNLAYLWEKSFFATDFLCTFNESFNKKYLILEELNVDIVKVLKVKLQYFYCDQSVLEETLGALKRFTDSLLKKKSLANTHHEFSESDLLSSKTSINVILKGIAKMKKNSNKESKQKKSWFQHIKNFFTYVKNKIQDLTIPALVVYYYCIKLIYFTNLKYILVFAFIGFIFYKYIYLNPKISLVLRWIFWGLGLILYLYFMFILFSKGTEWILQIFTYYTSLYLNNFLLVDIARIVTIYLIKILPELITISDILKEILYNLQLYVNNWIIIKLNYWTLLYIYLWPFIYSYKNIKKFLEYAWSVSYYRDPFFCYLSKFLAILYLYLFPSLYNVRVVNAGRISSILRWLYWNSDWLANIKNILKTRICFFFKYIQSFCVLCLQYLGYFLKTLYYSHLLRNILVTLILCYIAVYFLIYYIDTYNELRDENKNTYKGCMCYCGFSDTFGDKVKEKLFDLIPLRYKLSFESVDLEWLKILGFTFLWFLKYLNSIYIFLVKKLWLYFKHLIYTKYVGSLVEFYCEMHLWIEYYLFKILGDFLQPFFYIPYYVKLTTEYITEIPWLTFMDMHKLTDFFGLRPLLHSIEAYVRHRASLLKYQYWFWKNYEYEFNRKRSYRLHVFILQYWKLCLHYKFKQRYETRERILKAWYTWWDKNDVE